MGGSSSKPKPPPPLPVVLPPVRANDPAVTRARDQKRAQARKRSGLESTRKTGGGLDNTFANTGFKTLLGS